MKPNTSTTWGLWQIDLGGAAVCVLATLGAYFLGIEPLFRRHAAIASLRAELLARRDESRKLSNSLKVLQDQYGDVSEALSNSPLRLRTAAQTNLLLAEISTLAKKAGLKVDEVQPDSRRAGPLYEVVPIHLSGQGDYLTCVGFLQRLRGEFPDIGVVSFDMSSLLQGGGATTFSFGLEWYVASAS